MTDREAREFVEMLATPKSTNSPPCPICGHSHSLETRCVLPSQDRQASVTATFDDDRAEALEAAGLRE